MTNFQRLDKLVDIRGKTAHNGSYNDYGVNVKTDIAIHHSLTTTGDSASFARYHVHTNGWPGVAYHFVILPDGTIEWNHDLGVLSYHVGDANYRALGICLVGDFRYGEPTEAQKESLYNLHRALVDDLPNYKRTLGHNEYPQYSWKPCPEFDYKAVITEGDEFLQLNGTRRDYLAHILDAYADQGIIHRMHAEQVRNGEMRTDDAVFLLYVLLAKGAKD